MKAVKLGQQLAAALLNSNASRHRPTPHLDRAQELLGDFARFWHAEPNPAKRRKLLASLFDHIWQDAGHIVAVTPAPPSPHTSRHSTKPARHPQKRGRKTG